MRKNPPMPIGWNRFIPSAFCTFFAVTLFFSCSNNLDRESYFRWIQDFDNGLHVRKNFSEFEFDLQYQPSEYMFLQRGGAEELASTKNLQDSPSSTQYYTLTISIKDYPVDFIDYKVKDIQEKQQKLYYFSYQFQHDITLEENGKELPCVLFHFERVSNQINSRTFVLGFENPVEISGDTKLVIKSDHFSSLPIKIKVSKNNIPSLAI